MRSPDRPTSARERAGHAAALLAEAHALARGEPALAAWPFALSSLERVAADAATLARLLDELGAADCP